MINLSSLDLNNKNLVIRVDMNVPIKNGDVLDSTRIKACLSTIKYALNNNAKVLLISHLGRPIEGNFEEEFSLKPVANELSKIINMDVELIDTLESNKIFNSKIDIFATCVRVPVFVGHAESIYVETEKIISIPKLIAKIKKLKALSLVDEPIDGGYVTPDESAGENEVFISRLRLGVKSKKSLGLWVVADNLRKGAALNTIQIAELLIKKIKGK